MTPAAATTVPEPGRGNRFVFLDAIRAVAVCLVMYSHVVGIFLHEHHEDSAVAGLMQGFATDKLNLAVNMGNFGVVLFFLVSGFIVTHTGFAERPRQYAIKRFLRIYPMLVVSVLLAATMFTVGLHPVATGEQTTVTPLTILTNATLADHLIAPLNLMVDVTWTLIIEMLFYVLLLVALPLLRRAVWPVITGELALIAVVMATAHLGGSSYFLFAQNMSYLPALLLGQIVWAVWSRRIPLWTAILLGAVAWAEYVWAGLPGLGRNDTGTDHNLAFGLVIFVLALLVEPRLRSRRWIGWLADRSYSLYLLHGLLAFAVMNVLFPLVGFPVALVVGVAVTFLGSDLGFRFVERPCMRLARRLAARWGQERPGQQRRDQ